MLGAPASAEAAFQAQINTTAGSAIINDGGAGDLDGLVNGSITVNYGDSAYRLIGTIAFHNSPGTPGLALLDVSYNINTLGTTGGAASLKVSADGFTQPAGSNLVLTSGINGNGQGSGTLSLQQFVSTSNTLFGSGPSPGLQGPFNIGQAGGYGSHLSTTFGSSGPYALTEVLLFNLGSNSNTSGDAQSTVAVPAPASLLLAFSAVPIVGIRNWLRRRRNAA